MTLVRCTVVVEHAKQNLIVDHTGVCGSLDVVCVVMAGGPAGPEPEDGLRRRRLLLSNERPPTVGPVRGLRIDAPPTGVADNTSTRYARDAVRSTGWPRGRGADVLHAGQQHAPAYHRLAQPQPATGAAGKLVPPRRLYALKAPANHARRRGVWLARSRSPRSPVPFRVPGRVRGSRPSSCAASCTVAARNMRCWRRTGRVGRSCSGWCRCWQSWGGRGESRTCGRSSCTLRPRRRRRSAGNLRGRGTAGRYREVKN